MMTGKRRPHRSNSPLGIERRTESLKTIYWTESKLRKLLRRIIRNDRQEWFAARVRELKNWPERTKEEIMDNASRINPKRLMDGKWAWPSRELDIQRKLLRDAPKNSIDIGELRNVLAELDNRQGDRLIEILVESEFLKDTTVPLETGLPQPKEIGEPLLRRIGRLHHRFMPNMRLDIPRANIRSPSNE
jgi:hypothetical protein